MNDDVDVIVVGAGPTGLALACELALGGVRCRLLERRADRPNITRAFAVHARTLELLDARGLADELIAGGVPVHEVSPTPGATLDLSRIDSRYPMILVAPQSRTELLLEKRAAELGVEIVRGARLTGLHVADGGVRAEREDGTVDSAAYLVGCDGAHSTVRGLLGVDFVGEQYATHILLADVRLTTPPDVAMFATASPAGAVIVVPFGDGWFRAIAWDRLREQVPLDVPLPMAEMRHAFTRIAGTDFGMREQRWSSRFLSERRQARRYRVGRAFLAGDAAHVHSPMGAQGMNTGIGDAMNLGWKLAATVGGWAPPGLLESYETERHRVGRQVLMLTDSCSGTGDTCWSGRRAPPGPPGFCPRYGRVRSNAGSPRRSWSARTATSRGRMTTCRRSTSRPPCRCTSALVHRSTTRAYAVRSTSWPTSSSPARASRDRLSRTGSAPPGTTSPSWSGPTRCAPVVRPWTCAGRAAP